MFSREGELAVNEGATYLRNSVTLSISKVNIRKRPLKKVLIKINVILIYNRYLLTLKETFHFYYFLSYCHFSFSWMQEISQYPARTVYNYYLNELSREIQQQCLLWVVHSGGTVTQNGSGFRHLWYAKNWGRELVTCVTYIKLVL